MSDNTTYREMFAGRDGKTKIRPTIIKRIEDENKIETIYLIRDGYDAYKYKPNISSSALEFHVIYDKKTRKSSGTLYYDTYNIDYCRKTGGKVQDPYNRNSIQAHEGYKCTDLSRYKVQFFPPEINSINALGKCIEDRDKTDLEFLKLISTIEIEGLKQTLREQFELDQNTEILIDIFDTLESNILGEDSNNEYFFGGAFFNNRFFLFREFLDKKLELLECKPAQEIRTREDFERLTEYCLYAIPYRYCFTDKRYFRDSVAMLLNDPELFIQEEEPQPKQQQPKQLKSGASKKKRMKHMTSLNQISEEKERKTKEKGVIELDMNYKETLIKSNREPTNQVIDNLICKALETVAFQGYKYFTRKDIGFEYKRVDGLKIQHNIQDKQRLDLVERRLQFFKKRQEKQQLNHIQNAENNMVFQNERLHD